MKTENASQMARQWVDDWNRRDLEAILAHYDENIVFTSPFVTTLTGDHSGTLYGKDSLREYFTRALDSYPELHFELVNTLLGVSSIILYYHSVNNLMAAEWMRLDETGRVRQVQCHYTESNPSE